MWSRLQSLPFGPSDLSQPPPPGRRPWPKHGRHIAVVGAVPEPWHLRNQVPGERSHAPSRIDFWDAVALLHPDELKWEKFAGSVRRGAVPVYAGIAHVLEDEVESLFGVFAGRMDLRGGVRGVLERLLPQASGSSIACATCAPRARYLGMPLTHVHWLGVPSVL